MSGPASAAPQTATDDHYRAAMEQNIILDRRRLYDCMREATGEIDVNQDDRNGKMSLALI